MESICDTELISGEKVWKMVYGLAEAKLEEIAFQKAEVERELKSDPRSTSFGIRERVNAAKDEEQDLLPGVAANVSNLEIYETKFTLTRPLPFIGGKTLQMRTDMVDMFI